MKINRPVLAPLFVGVSLFMAASASGPVPAQTSDDVLPAEAGQAMRYGLAAAKQQEWELAVKYFAKAREAAPYAPEVLFNLALAYNNTGGRELPAIAWFHAFLAAAPDSANAERVRERVVALEVKLEADAAKLADKARTAAERIPDYGGTDPLAVVSALAETGDIAGAKEMAARASTADRPYYYSAIAGIQAQAGDIVGARETVELIEVYTVYMAGDPREPEVSPGASENFKLSALPAIAVAQAAAGDMAGALETIAPITDRQRKLFAEADVQEAGREAEEKRNAAREPYDRRGEIDSWARIVPAEPLFQNSRKYIQSLTDKDPLSVPYWLARAASDLIGVLKAVRENDISWRARRASGQSES